MKQSNLKKILVCIVCIVLIAAMALVTCGCSQKNDKANGQTTPAEMQGDTGLVDGKTYGEGKNSFAFTVTGSDGKDISVTIQTDKTIVGEALQELGIVVGEEGPYGLYVKTVNGETLDYDTDGSYWAFYINGEYASTGVDQTTIEDGVAYAFKAEKG